MLADFQSEANLFYLNLLLSFAVFGLLFGLLIAVLAPIQNLNDRRVCTRSDFGQIKIRSGCSFESLTEADDAKL